MSKVKLIAGHGCHYGVGTVPVGETFEAPEADAKILCALKRAKRAPEDAYVPKKPTTVEPLRSFSALSPTPVVSAAVPLTTADDGAATEGNPTGSDAEYGSDTEANAAGDADQPRQKRKYTRRNTTPE